MSARAKATTRSSLAASADTSISEENLYKVRALVVVALGRDPTDKNGLASWAAAVDAIFDLLLELDLAYYSYIKPTRIGVHPNHRYGLGVSASWMHALMANIMRVGWSTSACAGAICAEDDSDRTIAKFTIDMQAGSELFGKQKLSEIDFGSLAGSHTNQGLVAIVSGAPSKYEVLTSDGRMSQAKIENNHPSIAPVFETGMRWLVLKALAIELFPEILNLIQSTRHV